MTKKLTLLFRAKGENTHSIEKLFARLSPHFENEFEVDTYRLPCKRVTFFGLMKNCYWACLSAKGIVHITGDAQYVAVVLGRSSILTIHDCGHYQKLSGWRRLLYKWLWFYLPCIRAGKVTVISEFTRRELVRMIGQVGNRAVVVPNCLVSDLQQSSKPFDSDRPKILQIGSNDNKNLSRLIQAVKGLECELCIVGKISNSNLELLGNCGISFKNEVNVSETRLSEIYSECDLLFFASTYEGFGLPILEAQSVGLPVITSCLCSMPEVAGDGALYVDPFSIEEIRSGINKLIESDELRSKLRKAGFENLKRFSTQEIASLYKRIYREFKLD
ncbi:MAG: glycosyltransferase family 4 protein [Pirellula sp.]|jgi:glycosyltransferase involved in cell wall biosynthesis|nr:glycosyltransferase family 4 protein [Pirellula sp.]